jgi:hypothetical protein
MLRSRFFRSCCLWLAAATLAAAPAGLLGAETCSQLRVATFSCDVTPPRGGQPLIWVTPVQTVEDPLLAKGLVLDDGATRCVVCAVDWCGLCNSSHLLFRRKLAAAVGTDISRVAVQCVHQHTAPYVDGDAQKLLDRTPSPPRYVDPIFLEDVTDRLAAAAKQSLGRFQPVDGVGTGTAVVDRVASSRRIITPDGKLHGRMSSAKDPALRALPEGFIDPLLRTVTLARGGKPLARLHYYATHPQSFYGDPRACSDVPGFARERLQQKENVFQVYFTGCSGDVAMGKYNDGSRKARDELTSRLLAAMEKSAAATRLVPADRLAWRTLPVVLPLAADADAQLARFRKELANTEGNVIGRIRAATYVAFAERICQPLEISLLGIGKVRVLHLPGECMVEFQRFAEQLTPKGGFLAVAAYGDVGTGYICTAKAFAEGGYEPSASHLGRDSESVLKGAIRRILAGN